MADQNPAPQWDVKPYGSPVESVWDGGLSVWDAGLSVWDFQPINPWVHKPWG